MARERMTMRSEWLDAVSALPEEMQGKAMMAIVRYGLKGEMTAESGIISAIMAIIKPTIDIDNSRYDNACKGGAPRGNNNAQRNNRKTTEIQPKNNRNSTEIQPKNNHNTESVVLGGIIGGSTTTTTIRDNNNFNTDDVVVDDLCARLRAETVWVEAVCMNLHKDPEYIHRRLSEFCTEQKVQGVTAKSLGDAKRHFRYWLRKVEQIEADNSRRGDVAKGGRPYALFSYNEMLSVMDREHIPQSEFRPVYVGDNPKPMWVRAADKIRFNIPDKIAS